jgi:hypothetical protein
MGDEGWGMKNGGEGRGAELLAEVEQMDLETTIAFVEIRESDVTADANARLPIHSVNLMHKKRRAASSNLCQYKVSGKKFGYKQAIRKELETRTNVTLQNEEHAYKSHSLPFAVKLDREYVKKLVRFTMITPSAQHRRRTQGLMWTQGLM